MSLLKLVLRDSSLLFLGLVEHILLSLMFMLL